MAMIFDRKAMFSGLLTEILSIVKFGKFTQICGKPYLRPQKHVGLDDRIVCSGTMVTGDMSVRLRVWIQHSSGSPGVCKDLTQMTSRRR